MNIYIYTVGTVIDPSILPEDRNRVPLSLSPFAPTAVL